MWALCRYNLGILYKAQGKLDGTDILLKRGTQDCTSLLVPEQRATAGGYISSEVSVGKNPEKSIRN